MSVSPLTIQIAIAYHVSSSPEQFFSPETWCSDRARGIRNMFLARNMLTETEDGPLAATQKLSAWVEFICETPFPVQKWILPEREDDD